VTDARALAPSSLNDLRGPKGDYPVCPANRLAIQRAWLDYYRQKHPLVDNRRDIAVHAQAGQ